MLNKAEWQKGEKGKGKVWGGEKKSLNNKTPERQTEKKDEIKKKHKTWQ